MSKDKKINYGYGVTKATVDVAQETTVPMAAGINEDVIFVGCGLEKLSEDGDPVLIFNYAKDSKVVRDVIWKLDPDKLAERYEQYPPKEVKRANIAADLEKGDIPNLEQYRFLQFDMFNKRIKHILHAFIKDEDKAVTGDVASYEELSEAIAKLLKPFFGATVRLKVVLDPKDYSIIPKFGTFIEHGVEASASRLLLGRNDKVVKSGNGGAPVGGAPGAAVAPGMPAAPSAPSIAAPMAPPAPKVA